MLHREHALITPMHNCFREKFIFYQIPASDKVDANVNADIYTLSGRIGMIVASHAEVARSIPALAETPPIYTMHEALRGYCP